MDKKQREEVTIKSFLNYKQLNSQYANQLQSTLLSMDFEDSWKERPDLLFVNKNNKNKVIGIEHFLVDVLSEQQNAYSRIRENQQAQLLEKYGGDKLEGKQEVAAQELMNFIVRDLNKKDNIDCENFIFQFERVKNNHDSEAYILALNKLYDQVSLGYIIEITYMQEEMWHVQEKSGNYHKMRLSGLPISKDMLDIVQSIKFADFVILCTHEIIKKQMDFFVLDFKDFQRSIQSNKIHVCQSFTSASIGTNTSVEYNGLKNNDFHFTITKRRGYR